MAEDDVTIVVRVDQASWQALRRAYPGRNDPDLSRIALKPPTDKTSAALGRIEKLLHELEAEGCPRESLARLQQAVVLERKLMVALDGDEEAQAIVAKHLATALHSLSALAGPDARKNGGRRR